MNKKLVLLFVLGLTALFMAVGFATNLGKAKVVGLMTKRDALPEKAGVLKGEGFKRKVLFKRNAGSESGKLLVCCCDEFNNPCDVSIGIFNDKVDLSSWRLCDPVARAKTGASGMYCFSLPVGCYRVGVLDKVEGCVVVHPLNEVATTNKLLPVVKRLSGKVEVGGKKCARATVWVFRNTVVCGRLAPVEGFDYADIQIKDNSQEGVFDSEKAIFRYNDYVEDFVFRCAPGKKFLSVIWKKGKRYFLKQFSFVIGEGEVKDVGCICEGEKGGVIHVVLKKDFLSDDFRFSVWARGRLTNEKWVDFPVIGKFPGCEMETDLFLEVPLGNYKVISSADLDGVLDFIPRYEKRLLLCKAPGECVFVLRKEKER